MYPARTRRRLFLGASVSTAALAVVAAAAFPAFADPPISHGNANGHGTVSGPTNDKGKGKANGHRKNVTSRPTPTSSRPAATKGGSKQSAPGQTKGSSPRNNGKGASAVPPGQAKASTTAHGGTGGANGTGNGSGHNPPGNNGTVKVHTVANDPGHHNVPHVSCNFYVDFWGFDQGQVLDVSFTGQAPTGKGVPVTFPAPDGTEIISPDPAGGGNDFDGELAFQATADALAALGSPQAQQGYHVKLTVTTHQPGGHKYKVFWVSPCTSGSATTSSSTSTPLSTAPGKAGRAASTSSDRGRVLALHVTRTLPRSVRTAPTLQSLPFTGAAISGMLVAGLAALGAGTLMTMAGRRRRKIIALK